MPYLGGHVEVVDNSIHFFPPEMKLFEAFTLHLLSFRKQVNGLTDEF